MMKLKKNQIKIEKIKLKEIYQFASSALGQPPYRNGAAISLRRALSQSHNPYGRPNDVALLVALDGDQCVGYQGLLPGLLCSRGKLKRVHWSTAFYVSPDYRGMGVARCLLTEIKNLDIDFPVTRMTESAKQAYLKSGFKELGNLDYYQLRMEKISKLDTIVQKAEASRGPDTDHHKPEKFNSETQPHADVLYQRSKEIFYGQLMGQRKQEQNAFEHTRVDQINPQMGIKPQPDNCRFHRGIKAINWMLKYRWIISAGKEKPDVEPYYFSLVSDLFDYAALEIYSAGKKDFKGFLVLSISTKKGRNWVKILDFAFADKGDGALAAGLALIYAKKICADRLEFPGSLLEHFRKNPLLQPLIKKQQRIYLYYPKKHESALEECAGRIELDYCDADTAFT